MLIKNPKKSKTVNCLVCGDKFTRNISKFKNGNGKYCSLSCSKKRTLFKRGHKLVEGKYRSRLAKYSDVHKFVKKNLGKPKYCEFCGTKENRVYHWANKNHKSKKDLFERNLNNWVRLCVPCHYRFDHG